MVLGSWCPPTFRLLLLLAIESAVYHRGSFHDAQWPAAAEPPIGSVPDLAHDRRALALVSFQPHDPVQLPKQLAFFSEAALPRNGGCRSELIGTYEAPKMFEGSNGPEGDAISRQVHLHAMRRAPPTGG